MSDIAAVLLAGGLSTRMGSSKAAAVWDGKPLVVHMAEVLCVVADPVIVVAAADQKLPPLPHGCEVAIDAEPEQGPLEAMSAGFRVAQGRGHEIFVAAVDLPLLRPEFVLAVVDRLDGAQAAVPVSNGHEHYLAAAYRRELQGLIEQLLVHGERRVGALVEQVPTNRFDVAELPFPESLRNANTADELESLRQLAGA